MSFSRGDRVRILTLGLIEQLLAPDGSTPRVYKVNIGRETGSGSFDRTVYLTPDEIELINEVHNKDGWRDICADMIRLGKDKEAVALLVEKTPYATPYIKALEAFFECFQLERSPTLGMRVLAAHKTRETVYNEDTINAWLKIKELQR